MLMFQPLIKYADFNGRARRSEYWLFYLFVMIVYVVLMGAAAALGGGQEPSGPLLILLGLFGLGIIIPSLAVAVRRLHDTNRSGWWVLISFLPLIGGLVLFIFTVLDGTTGPNRFGPDPKGRGASTTSEVFA